MNLFIIPGNPPATYFYEQWGREILESHPQANVKVSHYPDLSDRLDSQTAMEQVLLHHHEQLTSFQSEVKAPVTLIGHSLGGYFALKLLEMSPDLINKSILLHPFLRKPTLRGQTILGSVASLWKADLLHKNFIKNRKFFEYFNSDLPFVSDQEILRSFHLARHEFGTIGKDQSPIVIKPELQEKIKVFYTKKDDWCTPVVINQLSGQVSVTECTLPHDFVVREKDRRHCGQLILAIVTAA